MVIFTWIRAQIRAQIINDGINVIVIYNMWGYRMCWSDDQSKVNLCEDATAYMP